MSIQLTTKYYSYLLGDNKEIDRMIIKTNATNTLELAKDLINNSNEKHLDPSEISIIVKGKPLKISEDTPVDYLELYSLESIDVIKKS